MSHEPSAGMPDESRAPASLDELTQLLAALEAGEGRGRLGRRTMAVLRDMVAAPRQSAVYSITELGAAFGVHASTLTRLAKSLGFRGFSEFQAVFRRHVAQTGHFYSEQASRLREIPGGQHQSLDVVSRIARDEKANIQGMLNNLDAVALGAGAALMARSPRVRVMGLRQSYAIASYFSYTLGMLRDDVGVLSPEHGVAHELAQLRRDDLLVVIGFAPYTRITVDAAQLAVARGVAVVAITDSYASPLAGQATRTFIAPAGGHFFSNSLGGALVLIQALSALVARELGDEALVALEEREALIAALGVEY